MKHENSHHDLNSDIDFIVIDITEQEKQENQSNRRNTNFYTSEIKSSLKEQYKPKQNSNSDEEIELSLVDSAFSNVFEAARPWNHHFIIQSHPFCEEELACCLDLAENFIKNKHSLALKLVIINRLEAYKSFDYEILAIAKLTNEILKNLDAQLNIDDPLNSLEYKFTQICFQDIFYRDLKEFEFSALSKTKLAENHQSEIRQAIFSTMAFAENRYKDSFTLFLEYEDSISRKVKKHKFEFMITETERSDLDFNTKFKLKCFESEFTDYIKNNDLLLNEKELNSCEEITKEFLRSTHKQEYKNIFRLLSNKKNSGEHLSSILCAVIEILSKLDSKIKNNEHLSQNFSKIAREYMLLP